MSRTVTITLTEDEIDRLDALSLIRDTRGARRSRLVAEFVRWRLAHLPKAERELVDRLVALRQPPALPSNVVPLRRAVS